MPGRTAGSVAPTNAGSLFSDLRSSVPITLPNGHVGVFARSVLARPGGVVAARFGPRRADGDAVSVGLGVRVGTPAGGQAAGTADRRRLELTPIQGKRVRGRPARVNEQRAALVDAQKFDWTDRLDARIGTVQRHHVPVTEAALSGPWPYR